MTKQIGAAIFEDATKLYLIYDGVTDTAMRPLFFAEQAARDWLAVGMPERTAPHEVDAPDAPVTVIPDINDMEKGVASVGSFPSSASKKATWLTGPVSFLEMVYTNGATVSRVF